jgi:hypothetical protein
VKLLTFGDGKVDKDAVLQAGKAQVDRLKAVSQEIVFEVLDIGGGGVGGGIEPSGLGLVEEVVDQVDELTGGAGDFGYHRKFYIEFRKKGRRAERLGAGSRGMSRPGFPVARSARRPVFLQGAGFFSVGWLRMGCVVVRR